MTPTHRLQFLAISMILEPLQHPYAKCNVRGQQIVDEDMFTRCWVAEYPYTDDTTRQSARLPPCRSHPPLRGRGFGSGSGLVRNGLASCA